MRRPKKQSVQETQYLQSRAFRHDTNSHNKKNEESGGFFLHARSEYKQWLTSKSGAHPTSESEFR